MENKVSDESLRCRFCDWKHRKLYKSGGRTFSGMDALLEHVDSEHPVQAEQIRRHAKDFRKVSLAQSHYEAIAD